MFRELFTEYLPRIKVAEINQSMLQWSTIVDSGFDFLILFFETPRRGTT